ncbi:MAG: V/A-type H+-transporting ATPase subunit E [Chlamydiales bacterium]|jgi:V/A-type H+-transporting ATPase subunit E
MKSLESGKDKIQYICDALRKETLEPAQRECQEIIAKARDEAEDILKAAGQNAEKIVAAGRECIERERSVFNSALAQACKQSLEGLKQDIEHSLFNTELAKTIENNSVDESLIAKLISAMVTAIEKDGMNVDLSAVIPASVSVDSVNKLLATNILQKLKEGSVTVGRFSGGAQLKVHDKKITIDITDEALKELLGTYLRKDFRRTLFQN